MSQLRDTQGNALGHTEVYEIPPEARGLLTQHEIALLTRIRGEIHELLNMNAIHYAAYFTVTRIIDQAIVELRQTTT